MERNVEAWRISYARGKVFLSLHDPESAMKSFEQALTECPVDKSRELGKILFFLGVALKKLGLPGCALRSWSVARKLDKHNFSDKFLERFTNWYGMIRQETPELDDWNAYYSIQLARYLSTKRSRRIGTEAEKDMIWELIREAWKELRDSVDLSLLDSREKLALFSGHRIVFPSFSVASQESLKAIPVDFMKKRRIEFDDQCFCGSGLPYKLCCGRIPCKDELRGGIF